MVSALLLVLIAVTGWFSLRSSLLVTLALALQLTKMMTASHFGVGQTWGPNSRTSTNFGDLKQYHPIIHPIYEWRNCPAMLASTQRVQTHDPPQKWKQWPLNSDQSFGFRIPKWTISPYPEARGTSRIHRVFGELARCPPLSGPARPAASLSRSGWDKGDGFQQNTFNLVFFFVNKSIWSQFWISEILWVSRFIGGGFMDKL